MLIDEFHKLFSIANEPETDAKVLFDFAFHPNPVIRNAVALNPATPAEAISQLKQGSDKHVAECCSQRNSF